MGPHLTDLRQGVVDVFVRPRAARRARRQRSPEDRQRSQAPWKVCQRSAGDLRLAAALMGGATTDQSATYDRLVHRRKHGEMLCGPACAYNSAGWMRVRRW